MARVKLAKPPPIPAQNPYPRKLSILVSESLHQRIRVSAAVRGTTMMEEARAALEAARWEKIPA
jgi:hypothetical protein